jgi:hypothetical protein
MVTETDAPKENPGTAHVITRPPPCPCRSKCRLYCERWLASTASNRRDTASGNQRSPFGHQRVDLAAAARELQVTAA